MLLLHNQHQKAKRKFCNIRQFGTFVDILKTMAPPNLLFINEIKVSDHSQGRSESSLLNSYYTKVQGRALLLSLDCSTLPLMYTLYCWVLSKEVSSTTFKVFGMTQPGSEPRSPGPLANTLPTRPMRQFKVKLATIVEGSQKAPFSIATTPSYREGRYSFPWIAPLYPWYIPYIAEC